MVLEDGQAPPLARRIYSEFRDMDDLSALIIEGLTLEVWGEAARACGSPQFRIAPEGSLAGGGGELWYPSDGL